MDLPVIEVANISKKYLLNKNGSSNLRDALWEKISGATFSSREFWALKDASFNVYKGESVGIIGENGAGKSTLLKIISRITEASSGKVIVRGKITSLLEIGTGFNAELTGRENIYLNGAIMGIGFKGVKNKFKEIVDFADIKDFIDVPMKRYSSGMYIRLAFSVAAFLDPEILLLDEVFSVGDIAFQKKSLDKITEIIKSGKTVLFVSHNLSAVENFCTRAIWLDKGKVVMDAPVNKTTRAYYEDKIIVPLAKEPKVPLHLRTDRAGSGESRLQKIDISNRGNSLKIMIQTKFKNPFTKKVILLSILNEFGVPLYWLDSRYGDIKQTDRFVKIECLTGKLNVIPGKYNVNAAVLVDGQLADQVHLAAQFFVKNVNFYRRGFLPEPQHGPCLIKQTWKNI